MKVGRDRRKDLGFSKHVFPGGLLDNMSALVERIETTGSMATGRPEIRFGPLGELVEATEGIPSGI